MNSIRYKNLNKKISVTLKAVSQRNALLSAVQRGRDARTEALKIVPGGEAFRHEVRVVKERCIEELEELVSKFTKKASERGVKVYFAKTGEDACNYILNLAKEKNAQSIIKSKSLTSEEIELNRPLEQAGLQVIETDLGERIIQMAGEKPYHLVFPAVHKTTAQVADLISQETGEQVKSELGDIMSLMRRTLRPIFLNANMGITGANIAIAETGSIVIETNEGNGRLVSTIPPVHVCIMGAEKIVETIEDAVKMILAHPVSSVGQMLTTYVSFIAGRSPLVADDGREFHIVILDNGRFQMRQDTSFRDALSCIRCGACMNICPTYGVLGGHVFGFIYPGPIGIPWTAQAHGLNRAAEFSDLCISCGLCKEICPADIDIPMMITKVKHQILKTEPQPFVNKVLMANESFAKIACATTPFSNWILKRNIVKLLIEKFVGIDKRRNFPKFKRKTFKKQFSKSLVKTDSVSGHKVAMFVDYYANYVAPELGVYAANLLKRAPMEVVLPKQKTSGYPYISYGELDEAEKTASYNVQKLFPLIKERYDVVSIEPTAVYTIKFVYPKLLEYSAESKCVAENTFEFFEYVIKLNEEGILLFPPQITEMRKFGFHIPCHQRALSSAKHTLKILRSLGFDVQVIETGTCCGMAGTFGLKHGPLGYELSTTVGEPLFDLFKNSGVDAILTESSVCKMQLEDGTGLEVLHPLELVSAVIDHN
ncbi:MAG: LUD domain-containing protein [bacterium]